MKNKIAVLALIAMYIFAGCSSEIKIMDDYKDKVIRGGSIAISRCT
ncbi:MAG: hypothetical protein HYV28_17105 [Ignavibacteriales bacterium]|nr:hypothetical protein [Ignavibacteriales bacterium]